MDQSLDNQIESLSIGSYSQRVPSFHSEREGNDEYELKWAQIERLSTLRRIRTSVLDQEIDEEKNGNKVVDVTKLGALERRLFIEKLIKHIEDDNLHLLQKQRERIDRVNVRQPTIEVRYKNLSVEAECELVYGRPLPTLWNSAKGFMLGLAKVLGMENRRTKISILKDVNGIIKPSRMTLLLGPPGCGKTTLLLALAGKLNNSLKATGDISYNGYRLNEFVPQKTSAYVSQYDLHIPEMTVRETLDFSARFQGVGCRAEIMKEVSRREKQAGIIPEPDIDLYMKAISAEGLEGNLQTDYILKIMGLDICADMIVGDAMRRGISGGQKKRLTTGEIIVGPTKALFMDEISNGLDSSTTYQITACLQQLCHITEATIAVSLLQPAPETYNLFDDVILMAEGKIVYHGARTEILGFFEECGFKCPERKGEAEFLQEVLSKRDQERYWIHAHEQYRYVSVDQFSSKFKAHYMGQKLEEELSNPYDKSQCHKMALSFSVYSLPKWDLFKACMARELLLMKRNSFTYIFKTCQLTIGAIITMTVFLRTQLSYDLLHANTFLGALFYTILSNMFNGLPELALSVSRLPVFYKQRDFYFYPAWAYSIPAFLLKVPISLIESLLWTSITYYAIGYSPEAERFFRQFLLLFLLHQMAISMCRFLASYFQTVVASTVAASSLILILLLFGGFVIPLPNIPGWLKWGFWLSPITYAEIGFAVNEFLAPRWQQIQLGNTNIGNQVLTSRGLNFGAHFYWISVGALIGYIMLLNIAFTLAMTFKKSPGVSRVIISREKLSQIQGEHHDNEIEIRTSTKEHERIRKRVLPIVPLALTFQDVRYYIDTPAEMKEQGYEKKKLQLLHNITGAFRPGILTALMGVSGAGKTTLLDVLAGRKTGGTVEGDIKISGYPKVQKTFARISGYCEQNDIHSPHITVEESIMFSAWLRLPAQTDPAIKSEFVNEVIETIELDEIKDNIVGIPGVNGLSTEQRKRLTIAVELVSNPSIIFMDEPTTGLDARAAAIVMRVVKNIVKTGRTVVCTIHQPSIEIFETFDELTVMKRGGELIYSGPIGQQSCKIIEYFEGIPGIPRINYNYNPAAWMLEVTSTSVEMQLGIDFAQIYKESSLYRVNEELVRRLSIPTSDSHDLHFPTPFPLSYWGQFKACLWKLHLSYWRNPSYNLVRVIFVIGTSVVFAVVFWNHGKDLENQQDLFNVLGSMYIASNFMGTNNCSSSLPIVSTERAVLYREKYAGMYSTWAYSCAQMVVEIPYIFLQTLCFAAITYPAIGYYWSANKFFWYLYAMFCTLLYFVYLGMLLVSLTPNLRMAAILSSPCYAIMNLFSGYMIRGPKIQKWWIWLYYISPLSWTLNGLFTSQYGDVEKEITAFGERKPVAHFLRDYFGYRHDHLRLVGVILIIYPLVYGLLFGYCMEKLNFQKR